jgi:hypothetical protein
MTQTSESASDTRHACPGVCGRTNLPRYMWCCPRCTAALDDTVREMMHSQVERTRERGRDKAIEAWSKLRNMS